ncbi:hypothetical protein NIES4102_25810 [Chondrocystis sp. NIES-4102]|nr:hypothetical protein NIES4102_25810 [Chondrocystis sp. NIES-4102]
MNCGDSVVHNRFVVPDWGALRFDVHVPNSATGEIKVYLNDEELKSSAYQGLNPRECSSSGNASHYPAVNIVDFEQNTSPGLNPKIAEGH